MEGDQVGGWREDSKGGRRILRCHGKTSNEAVLGELGWWRLKTRREFKLYAEFDG